MNNLGKGLEGNISSVKMWNIGFNNEDINYIINSGSNVYDDALLFNLDFKEQQGYYVIDKSERGNDFKLYNKNGTSIVDLENDLTIPEWSANV
jgi:hypothetical protein